jgi:hypothetical protein
LHGDVAVGIVAVSWVLVDERGNGKEDGPRIPGIAYGVIQCATMR